MAKEPEMYHRFKITAEISSEKMGDLLATLTIMGLENINYELITDIINFKGKIVHEISSADLAKTFVEQNPTFRAVDITKYFMENGRTKGAGYPALQKLVEAKIVRRIAPGQYQRADVRAIAPPTPATTEQASKQVKETKTAEKKPHARTGIAPPRFEITGADAVWNFIKNRKKFTMKELAASFEEQGRNAHSVSPLVTKLGQAKKVRPLGDGVYEVLKNTKPDTPAKKTTKPKAKAPTMTAEQQRKEARNEADRIRRARKAAEAAKATPANTLNGQGEQATGGDQ